ncbi:hypothetical protein MVEN_00772500 [Mycena venus]|uniref:Uncharacterized protein n=1 Tax=Mycena venus TaxID=2733690 RepID=A0A8H6YLE8_9AGAR|nr:hypothetical protein MVEN_00772500 [Mycena venus]
MAGHWQTRRTLHLNGLLTDPHLRTPNCNNRLAGTTGSARISTMRASSNTLFSADEKTSTPIARPTISVVHANSSPHGSSDATKLTSQLIEEYIHLDLRPT